MRKFGVGVIIIEPGDFAGTTGMLSAKSVSVWYGNCILDKVNYRVVTFCNNKCI
jgi:hypothetical protein